MSYSIVLKRLCLLLLGAVLVASQAWAGTPLPLPPTDYVKGWETVQGWIYEGMQESDEPVPQREGEAWNKTDPHGLTVLDYALAGASPQELGTVTYMANAPGIDLLGVTCVTGNSWMQEGVAYGLRHLEIEGRNIPVLEGMRYPLRPQRHDLFEMERAQFGMGHDSWLDSLGRPEPAS